MFMERNYQKRKQILWWDIAFCEIASSVETLTMGMVSGLNVYAWEGWEEPVLTKCPEQGDSATSVPACMTWLLDMAAVKLQRLKGSRRGHLFLIDALKACSGSQTRSHETKYNNWKNHHPPICVSCRRQEGFNSSGTIHTQDWGYTSLSRAQKNAHTPHTFLMLQDTKGKFQNQNLTKFPQHTVLCQLPKLSNLVAIKSLLYLQTISGSFRFKEFLSMYCDFWEITATEN